MTGAELAARLREQAWGLNVEGALDTDKCEITLGTARAILTALEGVEEMRSALKGLLTAVEFAGPPTLMFGEAAGLCYEARVPDDFVKLACAALKEKP